MKLLVADDSNVSRTMLSAITKSWGYQVILAEDGEQAWQIMQEDNAPQLLLLDWEMPKMNGIEVCERVIAKYPENPPYIVLLTSRSSSDDIVEGLSKGANDYLSKPFDTAELQVRLQVGKRMVEMQDKLNDTLNELKELASHDSLTGLLNRRAIMEGLPKEIKRMKRQEHVLCIGMCDIDHFKQVNDTYGHLVGDEVLKEVTKRMAATLREYDLLGRYGGEEFLVITPVDSNKNGLMVYQRICDVVSSQAIKVNNLSISVTISCGVATYSADSDVQTITELIARADEALYQAKDNGRNQVVFK
ncbi:MAG: diguanylate cyclase [Colwellia sp.]|nr:diguanylate cyclase [Colwellia sp.]